MAVDISPTLAPASPVYPEWWVAGVQVVGLGGEHGWIQGEALKWLIHTGSSYFANPNPSYWTLFMAPVVSAGQRDRIAYEAAAALYEAFGVGGVKHWTSLTDGERMNAFAAPGSKHRPELAGLRSVLIAAVKVALEPYVK